MQSCLPFYTVLIALLFLTSWQTVNSKQIGTRLSGFGARSRKKTIFRIKPNSTSEEYLSPLSTPQTLAKNFFSTDLKLLTEEEPHLWARHDKDPGILWLQTRDEDQNPIRTLKVSVSKSIGEWQVEEERPSDTEGGESTPVRWVPIEGIYGLYQLPSGFLWVLITKTEPVYTAPPLLSDPNEEDVGSWWKIRRVSNFELVHLDFPGRGLSEAHLKEEVRQLRLLRLSLKEHEFYLIPKSEDGVVQDITQNLQTSLKDHLDDKNSAPGLGWWEDEVKRPDPRFFWNEVAVDPLVERYDSESTSDQERDLVDELLRQVVPVTSAFVGIQANITDAALGVAYDQLLISRRSRFRAGTRFTRRGADASGAVANFAETEQICLTLDPNNRVTQVMSHLQTRGSIPLRWSSPADVKTYRPRVNIGTDPLAQARALRLHLLEQFSFYVSDDDEEDDSETSKRADESQPKLVFVNLIDKKKDQGRLGQTFEAVLNAVMEVYAEPDIEEEQADVKEKEEPVAEPKLYDLHAEPTVGGNAEDEVVEEEDIDGLTGRREEKLLAKPNAVEHVWFDFHAEVKDGKWHRLGSLLNDLEPALTDHGYFLAMAPTQSKDWEIVSSQNAIVRTNCMDCLDRTNVVQSLFGRYMFFNQLSAAMGSSHDEKAATAWNVHHKSFTKNPMTIPWEAGEKAHRLLWADNADAISRLYAGTPALKGDFTRTGQRTKKGALDDGMNSLQRYYLNNFIDADRQEGMDLLVGYADFSNSDGSAAADDIGVPIDSSTSSGHNDFLQSVKEAARKNIFASAMDGTSNSGVDTLETSESLDLRWLPGDLQSHVLSQADDLTNEDEIEDQPATSEFSSSTALAAIDKRAASDLPWWAGDNYDGAFEEKSIVASLKDSQDDRSPDQVDRHFNGHQLYPRISPVQAFALLLIGYRAPTSLAAAVVSLFLLIFLPGLLQSHMEDE